MRDNVIYLLSLIATLICFILYEAMTTSCNRDEGNAILLTFIGDSEVSRWDVPYFFPEYHTVNKGISGAGLTTLEEMAGTALDSHAVVILGTNDIHTLSMDGLAAYADRYVAALESLKGSRTYVFSIFPRSFATDQPGMNTLIKALNSLIKERIQGISSFTYIDVYEALERGDGIHPEYSYDGLHLSKQGYELISSELKKALR